nr:calmodulin-like protein [Crepidula fornicata]
MLTLTHLILVMVGAILGAAPPVLSLSGRVQAPWRLEGEAPFVGATRTRRGAFPASGMPCLTVPFLTDMKGRFADRIDPDDNGKASRGEIRQYLRHFNPEVREQQVTAFIQRRDLNGDGVINFIPEYVMDIATPDMTPEAAREWFDLEDTNRDGYVTRAELMTIAQQLGMTSQQADASVSSYYMSVDRDGDDRLDFDEYKVLYGQ